MGILTDKYIQDLTIDAGDNIGWINIKEYEQYHQNAIRKQVKQYRHLSKSKRKLLRTAGGCCGRKRNCRTERSISRRAKEN